MLTRPRERVIHYTLRGVFLADLKTDVCTKIFIEMAVVLLFIISQMAGH